MTRKTKADRAADTVTKLYEQLRPTYIRLASRLADLFHTLLDDADLRFHVIEHRAKEVSSLRQKMLRPEKQYSDPLKDVTDLAGVRIIVYHKADVGRVGEIIREQFAVDELNSSDRGAQLRPNEFGYQSVHYVVRLDAMRSTLPEWRSLAGLVAEIQVRTVVQHAWAAIAHSLQYKTEAEAPAELARRLFRLSGLLELADEEFAAVGAASVVHASRAEVAVKSGNLSVPIDRSSLVQYVASSPVVVALTAAAREAGFGFTDLSDGVDSAEEFTELAWVSHQAKLNSIAELNVVCLKRAASAASFLKRVLQRYGDPWEISPAFVVVFVVLWEKVDVFTIDGLVVHGWHNDNAAAIVLTAQEQQAA